MEESYFDGGLAQFVGYRILGVIITVLTVGICLPWAYTMMYRWETEHSVIDGRRLVFDGSAVGLFGNWVKWFFLTVITLGIYSLWVSISLRKWKTKHTYRSYAEPGTESYFDGGLLQLVGYRILGAIITVCTLGICLPWAYTMVYSWQTKHTIINGKRLKFNGSGVSLFANWIVWFILTIVTLGIYGFWVGIKLRKWKISHTTYVSA